jgi:hypothetical protein
MATCAFCINKADSGEHIWADWLKAYVPRTNLKHHHSNRTFFLGRTESSVTHRSGDQRSRKVRFVCSKCNTQWMSRLQIAAKPIVVPLLSGSASTLDREAQTSLSGWIAMAIIASEHLDTATVVTTRDECRWLRTKLTAPPQWRIWIGNYHDPDHPTQHRRCLMPVVKDEEFSEFVGKEGTGLPYTLQTVSYRVGDLFVHAITSSAHHELVARIRLPESLFGKLLQIWPAEGMIVKWPPTSLTREDVDVVADFLFARAVERGRVEAQARSNR